MLVCLEAFKCIMHSPSPAPKKSVDIPSPAPPAHPDSIDVLTRSPMPGHGTGRHSARTPLLKYLATTAHDNPHHTKVAMKSWNLVLVVLGILLLGSHTNGLAHQQDEVI